jgi:hypothetical protein
VHVGITTVGKRELATDEGRREAVKRLEGLERGEVDHLAECLVLHEELITALDGGMAERAKGDEGIKRLRTVPGVGPKIAFAFSAFVNGER